jgi:alpha-tubulin suppressor-like RCC1 family protein
MRILIAVTVLFVACDAAVVEPEPGISQLEIEPVTDALFPGDTTRLVPIVKNTNGEYIVAPAVTWESTDTTIIRVTENGRAIAVRAGTASIRMRYRDAETTHTLRVDPGFVFIETGPAATCGLMHDGDLYCWGEARAIGNVTTGSALLPRRVPTFLRFQQFSVGSNGTCAVTFDQKAYCWGTGRKGESGTGSLYFWSDVPVEVAGNLRFRDVSVAWEHACGLTPEGVAYCWGRNYEGQLGLGDWMQGVMVAPAAVKTDLRFKQLQAAGTNTCGLTHEGHVYCWGDKNYLGAPGFTEHQPSPVRVQIPVIDVFDSANEDPCGITPDKQMYCWTNTVEAVPMVGSVSFVTVGGGHICVRQINDRVVCYGRNVEGQLGDGTFTDSAVPIEPAGSLKFAQISAGAQHTCGVTDTGAAYCWGWNRYGQLGDGTHGAAGKPTRVLIPRD